MKKLFYLLLISFTSILTNAQNENLIKNSNDFYLGNIDKKTNIKVVFDSVSLENNSPETYKVSGHSDVEGTKADFSGTIIFNSQKTRRFNESTVKFYDYKFSEKGSGKHNGVFSGYLMINKSTPIPILNFEGNWENYDKTLSFDANFDNKNKLDE